MFVEAFVILFFTTFVTAFIKIRLVPEFFIAAKFVERLVAVCVATFAAGIPGTMAPWGFAAGAGFKPGGEFVSSVGTAGTLTPKNGVTWKMVRMNCASTSTAR